MIHSKQITYSIHKAVFLLDKLADRVLGERLDLTYSQFRMLLAVNHRGAVSQKDIAKFWEVTEAAVSRQLEVLRVKGLVGIAENAKDRRAHVIALTPKGKEKLNTAIRSIDQAYEEVYQVVKPGERRVLVEVLGKLLRKMCEEHQSFFCQPKAAKSKKVATKKGIGHE